MHRSTLTGVGLSIASVVLPLFTMTFARPAQAQTTRPSSDAARVEQRIRREEQRIQQFRTQIERAHDAYRESERLLEETEAKIRALTGRADTSRESLSKAASRMDEEVEELSLEQVGADARQKALEEAIARQAKRAEIAVEADDVATELMKVIDARAAQLKRIEQLHASGVVPDTEVGSAQAALAEARAKLAERRQQSAAAGGGTALAEWTRELLNLSIANAERRAKLEYLEVRRKGLGGALQQAEGLSRAKDAMMNAEKTRRTATAELEEAESMLRELRALAAPTTNPQ